VLAVVLLAVLLVVTVSGPVSIPVLAVSIPQPPATLKSVTTLLMVLLGTAWFK
jgi:hypothetical protein